MATHDRTQLVETLSRLEREKGDADGLIHLLNTNIQALKDENFDLLSSMSLFETETRIKSETKEREMQSRIAALESELVLISDKLQNTERSKLRVTKMVEELQQKQLVEKKRFDAERRLMATKRRKHESFLAATQSVNMSQYHSQQASAKAAVSVVEAAVQTEVKMHEEDKEEPKALQEENARLISYLLTILSRHLLVLLNGTGSGDLEEKAIIPGTDTDRTQGGNNWTPTQFMQNSSENSLTDSLQHSSSGIPFSQSVFSQMPARASGQPHASVRSGVIETKHIQNTVATKLAQELYDVMGNMLAGDVSAVSLAPVFIKYFAAQTDLEPDMIRSMLRVMYAVMHHSARFQQFLMVTSDPETHKNSDTTRFSRITSSGLQFPSFEELFSAHSVNEVVNENDFLPLESAAQQKLLCSKLMSELCQVVKRSSRDPAIVKDGLCVLSFWVDLDHARRPMRTLDLRPLLTSNVIPSLLLAANSLPEVQAQTLGLLSQIISIPEVFSEMEAESKKSLLFNRCAKMLSSKEKLLFGEASEVRTLQHQIITMMLSIITSFPSKGIRFVLESTHGLSSDSDGHRSIIYYLVQLLHQETFHARTSGNRGEKQKLLTHQSRFELVQNALALLGLLSRYVDLRHELGGNDDVQLFLAVLYFLSDLSNQETTQNDFIGASARTLIVLVNEH